MACAMRERLIVEGPEAMEAHLEDCPRCAADLARLEQGMAHLWDGLDAFVDADVAPAVVGGPPPVAPTATPRWPAALLTLAAAALLVVLALPREPPPPAAPAVESTVPHREPLPLEGELDAEQVVPLASPQVLAPPPSEAGTEVPPMPPPAPCPEALAWWRLETPVPEACRADFVAAAGPAALELHRVLIGEREAPWYDEADGYAMRAFAQQTVLQLSQQGRHGDATLLVARLVDHPLFQTRGLWRAGALAGRDWVRAADTPEEAEARRRVALGLAEGWVDAYRFDNDDSNVMAITVRDALRWGSGE